MLIDAVCKAELLNTKVGDKIIHMLFTVIMEE